MAGAVALATSIGGICPTDTFQNYISNTSDGPGTGCTVAGPTVLEYDDFFFATSTTGENLDTPNNITVTPNGNTGFNFTGFPTISASDLTYYLAWDVLTDPAPVLTGDSISLDPPSGLVTMNLYVCLNPDQPYINENGLNFSCGTAPLFADSLSNQTIFLDQPNAQLSNSATPGPDQSTTFDFGSAFTQYGVLITLTLNADAPASVGAIGSTPQQISLTPEPGTWLMLGTGLAILLFRQRRRFRLD